MDSATSMVPVYQYLIDGGFGLDILVYSGDDDSVCGTVGTQSWIWDMGYVVRLIIIISIIIISIIIMRSLLLYARQPCSIYCVISSNLFIINNAFY